MENNFSLLQGGVPTKYHVAASPPLQGTLPEPLEQSSTQEPPVVGTAAPLPV